MAEAVKAAPESRVIRVFLSSTFRDFMEERDLLVKQVFPELRRKARERGVDVVDVDLRWGITEEESRQGKVIPICLGEIDRCRPYFVGMLGERYGWIPPADQYSPEVIERQPWLKEHLGGVSVTELEILHGVLNDPAMAGRAFFYFRDPAWSASQSEPGFVCESAEEKAKLADLKQRIRDSRFPVEENLADPKALADRIGQDLWELIEEQYPDLDEADALEREERQHASYRRSRLGVYLGGKRSINQLERWIDASRQKILITGESGAGKSALIANWIEAHQQNHPEDVVFAHHLGCSNDASAIRPLLMRLIDTAKEQLPEVYGYSLDVPQDWWELVAKAVEALQSLGRWAQQNNHRWIWVLDGLDRLAPDDQKALPWLPLTIPEGVVIVTSALECPAREILLERKFKTHTIEPLKAKDQDALIQQYLGRYTKQLIAELRQSILSHPLAGSPLFLRVLLEELRQCGRYETLADQLAGYLSAETIDDLYERVLERLEADGNGENVRKVMTALWASRAGLSEEELLAITGLAPLQWAPINLALEEALGRNGNRLVFDHDYLRKAVSNRYIKDDADKTRAHARLARWFSFAQNRKKADPATDASCMTNNAGHKIPTSRITYELPWQLLKAGKPETIEKILSSETFLLAAASTVKPEEIWRYWQQIEPNNEFRMEQAYESEWDSWRISLCHADISVLADYVFQILVHGGKHGSVALKAANTRVELAALSQCNTDLLISAKVDSAELRRLRAEYQDALAEIKSALDLANKQAMEECRMAELLLTYGDICMCINEFERARSAYERAKEISSGPRSDYCALQLGWLDYSLGRYTLAEKTLENAYWSLSLQLGRHHSWTTQASNNLALAVFNQGDIEKSMELSLASWSADCTQLGEDHWISSLGLINYGWMLHAYGARDDAKLIYEQTLNCFKSQLGPLHPLTALALYSIGWHEITHGDCRTGRRLLLASIDILRQSHGHNHPDIAVPIECLAWLDIFNMSYNEAIQNALESISLIRQSFGDSHPNLLLPMAALGIALAESDQVADGFGIILNAVDIAHGLGMRQSLDFAQILVCMARVCAIKGDIIKASELLNDALQTRMCLLPPRHPDINAVQASIACISRLDYPARFTLAFSARRFCGSSTM